MQLKIRRADGAFDKTKPPCKKAEPKTFVRTDRFFLCGDPVVDEATKKMWRSAGSQHRIDGNVLYRDVTETSWFFLWLGTGPMRELVDTYGPVILRRTIADPDLWEVVIDADQVTEEQRLELLTDRQKDFEHNPWK